MRLPCAAGLVVAACPCVPGFLLPLPAHDVGHQGTLFARQGCAATRSTRGREATATRLYVGGKIFGEDEPPPPPQGQPGLIKPAVKSNRKEDEEGGEEGGSGEAGTGEKRKRRKRRKKYDFSDDLAAREQDEKRLAEELARKFPDIGRVKVDKFGNIVGGVDPFEGTDVKLEDQPIPDDDEKDFPEVAGVIAGMDDPADAPWRLEAEKIVRDQVQACGLTCYDILWTFHRLEVTVTRAEGDGPIEEAAYVDSDKLMQAIKGVNAALEAREEELFVLGRHELVVATPGAKDVLTTDKQFKAYKGFEVIVKAGGPFKKKRELKGKLLERTFDELMIMKAGRKVRIPLALVDEVRLPPALVEAGDEVF
ncbi:unnamed protein product [Ectocarpus sp. CCAP 1310/34]|nr:unnamed protein product [Ectocarpus sp. CCAP 1310/34]